MNLQWFLTALGFALLWGLWTVVRWFRSGGRKRPSGALTGVAALLVVCIAVGLVLGWRTAGIIRGLNSDTTRQTLGSGREIEVVSKTLLGPVWILEYRTRIPKRNQLELLSEADEIWKGVRQEAEHARAEQARLSPVYFTSELRFDGIRPVILKNLPTGMFILSRRPDGTWKKVRGWPSQ
jgi:hypothetical protein